MKKWLLFLAIVTFIIFFFLLINFNEPFVVQFDNKMVQIFGGNKFIIMFHYLGETKLIAFITLIMILLLSRERDYRAMLFILLTIPAGNALNQGIKKLIRRPRPEIIDQLTSFSFPSGHAMMSVLYLFTIAYLVTKTITSRKKIVLIWGIVITLAMMIGLSRVAESRHFASDVIAGWSIGYSWFILCVIWYENRQRKLERIKKNS